VKTFFKAQAALILGSIADFLITIILVEIFKCWYIIANLIGNICGNLSQFIISRNWAFKAGDGKISSQFFRFILVWLGNLLLSAAGVFFFTRYIHLNYIISKTITSVLLGLTYNYLLQKEFVFSHP